MGLKISLRGVLFFLLPGIVGCSMDAYRYILPEGYVGWVQIRFEIAGAAPLPREGRFRIARFPASGVVETSEGPLGGDSPREWLYENAAGQQRPAATQSSFGSGNSAIRGSTSFYTFIGTSEQNDRLGKPRLGPTYTPVVGPIADP